MACMISVGAYRKNAARGEKRMDGILEDQSNEQNKTGIMKHRLGWPVSREATAQLYPHLVVGEKAQPSTIPSPISGAPPVGRCSTLKHV